MKECFDIVKNKLLEGLSSDGYELKGESSGSSHMTAVLANAEEKLLLEYNKKLFAIYRGAADDKDTDLVKSQTYLFDREAGDGAREAASVAAEFLETLQKKPGAGLPAAQPQRRRSKDKDTDETTAAFFVNRIATVMPECREPLRQHKAHYEQVLPRCFCEEVVLQAQRDMLAANQKGKMAEYFQLLGTMYTKGDLDTRSIIMQVLLADLSKDDYERIEKYFEADFIKSWVAARKYNGKNVRPEKKTAMAKLAAYQAETLNGQH